jgi:transposase-like protein
MANAPKTLQEAVIYFADAENCRTFLAGRRWPNGVVCPRCGSKNVGFIKSRGLWQCKDRSHPKAQFSIKVGTIFEDSAIGLDKWLTAMWMLANCKNGVSSHELGRSIGVTQKSAWFMLQRLRLALQDSEGVLLSGEVEADESFIGGKARNMHASKRATRIHGRGTVGKAIVMGMLERKGKVKATVVETRRKHEVQAEIRQHVAPGSTVYTDELLSYDGLHSDYAHKVINHAEEYVRGNVHTNGMENFWSLLKRGIGGTYVSVEPFHLFRYLDEQAWRYNNRKDMSDADRFALAASQIVGKRLTFAEVTGKDGETTVH